MINTIDIGTLVMVAVIVPVLLYWAKTRSPQILKVLGYYSLLFPSIAWYYLDNFVTINRQLYSAVRVLLLLISGIAVYRICQILWPHDSSSK